MASASENQHLQGSIVPWQQAPKPVEPGVTIGHVHLRTSDIDRVRGFYVDLMGFDVVMEARDVPGWGTTGDVLFVAAGGYHHHLGFNTWKSAGGGPQPDGGAGLHHVAIRYPSRARLPDPPRRLPAGGRPRAPPRAAPASPTRCAGCRRWTGRCASAPTTARTRRSTSPTPTATTWSSA